ncbi:ceroid-lipofuscinosis neuronal [Anaeramoeba flamelloides]|uniref:Ceroid-lipofuscinosis neuronal n=1 Tax=Anaeramoeba flamelloides TaxID=1746091 RepID=A0AAV7YK11_9EUKA|nr:ceroid-lipofuscinosis neuronal [Anaeramoeba flamelloides]
MQTIFSLSTFSIFLIIVCCVSCVTFSPKEEKGQAKEQKPSCVDPNYVYCPNRTAIPSFGESDQIDIYYLTAPLLKHMLNNTLSYVNLYHSAIGFHHLASDKTYAIEYAVNNGFINLLEPIIYLNSTGQKEILHCDYATLCFSQQPIFPGIETYYTNATKVAEVTGTEFNTLLEWSKKYNLTHQAYRLFMVLKQWPNDKEIPFFDSVDCMDFTNAFIDACIEYGVHIVTEKVRRDYSLLFTLKPELVDISNPVYYNEVVKFYEELDIRGSGTWQILKKIVEMLYNFKFMRDLKGNYYRLTPIMPFVGNHYEMIDTHTNN